MNEKDITQKITPVSDEIKYDKQLPIVIPQCPCRISLSSDYGTMKSLYENIHKPLLDLMNILKKMEE